ncbi:hypothetical protein C8R42DRAFT_591007, partial [Lentinula raphanica]
PCPGIMLSWKPGSIWDTYPFALHAVQDVGWIPIGPGHGSQSIQLRSDKCQFPTTGGSGLPCDTCCALEYSSRFINFMAQAEEVKERTPWKYLTSTQREKLMKKMTLTAKQRRISDHSRIMMMLANHDFPALRRLLSVALRRGASPNHIIEKLQQSLDKLYSPRGGFTQRDLDIAFIAKALGGRRLLYTLTKGIGLPSDRTIRNRFPIPKLLTSIGPPTSSEIDNNISAFFNPSMRPASPSYQSHPSLPSLIPGNVLMFDGIALEGRCRYCPQRDVVSGFCREHGQAISMKCDTIESIENMRKAVEDGKLCFGCDATVVALAPYGRSDHYSPVPLVLSPSDKTEKGEQLSKWIQTLLDCWRKNEHGATLHGPIWSLASDGDSTFRLAKHLLCMTTNLNLTSDLGRILCNLPGLNLCTSQTGITGTCDPKHIFKRFATLLRSPKGVMVFRDYLTPDKVIKQLCSLEGVTLEKAQGLLDPSDKQNVPKAVSLIQHLLQLKNQNTEFIMPSEVQHRNSLIFLAEVLGYFLQPFIDIDMSLSEQLKSLSTFAHLAAAMYLKHGTACFTGALYHDCQAVIKNIYFTVARMQLVSPDLSLYIILEGTDRLEGLFSDVRTQDHARNFDIAQLSEKLGSSTILNATYQRNPDLDQGHRRLSLKDAMGIDHINPRSWKGNVQVNGVQLDVMWNQGQVHANKILKERYSNEIAEINPKNFNHYNCDLLRPTGGKYVGLNSEVDDERSERAEDSGEQSDTNTELNPNNEGGIEELGIDLDDFMPPTPEEPSNESDSIFSKTMKIGEKTFYKSSLVATLCSNRAKKVTMRTLRARGVALEDLQKTKQEETLDQVDLDGPDLIKTGDVVGILVRINDKVAFATMEITGFQSGTSKSVQSFIEFNKLDYGSDTNLTVSGHILELNRKTSNSHWYWTGQYIKILPVLAEKYLTRRHLVIEVSGTLIFPLAPSIITENSIGLTAGSTPKLTWSFDEKQLLETFETAWQALDPESQDAVANLAVLPIVNPSEMFPYSDNNVPYFVLSNLPNHLKPCPKLTRLSKVECFLCKRYDGDKKIALYKMREHVGLEPCGFCGQDECITSLRFTKNGHPQVSSNCPYYYEGMRYIDPVNTSKKPKCTNTPIQCSLCPPSSMGLPLTIWKYNFSIHVAEAHTYDQPADFLAPAQMISDAFISQAEEVHMGIDAQDTEDFRNRHMVPDSDGFEAVREVLKRDRAATITVHTYTKRARAGTYSKGGKSD